jgi:hypothetical protein
MTISASTLVEQSPDSWPVMASILSQSAGRCFQKSDLLTAHELTARRASAEKRLDNDTAQSSEGRSMP